jgi:hypothetical protein
LASENKVPESFKEIIDVLIGEVALTRRKIESLLDVLDEEGIVSKDRFQNKLKEKTEKEKLEILIKSLSERTGQK